MTDKPIYVTQPDLPPLEEFIPYLEAIWDNKILTNGGPFHQQLEKALCEYLGVKHISLFANGTLALITALQTLRVTGEVITTPYSFLATAHSLLWNGIKPVFVDIDPNTFNIDPDNIEAAITSQTSAILPVHCYGHPCDVDRIQQIADKYSLKVIYDAAHAFGVQDKGGSILRHGDLSTLSFHATKVFNTFEGGAIICPDAETKQRIDHLKNFGLADETTIIAPGINGKMNEVQAAMGVLQLSYVDEAIFRRKTVSQLYHERLKDIDGICIPDLPTIARHNYSYFPILIRPSYQISRNALYEKLKSQEIFSRRYFYPLITDFSTYADFPSARPNNVIKASNIASQVLCLPIYPHLEISAVDKIARIIKSF
jgi:dTDP-4-amino-4,6-dideoxygalactose transaminase